MLQQYHLKMVYKYRNINGLGNEKHHKIKIVSNNRTPLVKASVYTIQNHIDPSIMERWTMAGYYLFWDEITVNFSWENDPIKMNL